MQFNCFRIWEIYIIFRPHVETSPPDPDICNGNRIDLELYEWPSGTGAPCEGVPIGYGNDNYGTEPNIAEEGKVSNNALPRSQQCSAER